MRGSRNCARARARNFEVMPLRGISIRGMERSRADHSHQRSANRRRSNPLAPCANSQMRCAALDWDQVNERVLRGSRGMPVFCPSAPRSQVSRAKGKYSSGRVRLRSGQLRNARLRGASQLRALLRAISSSRVYSKGELRRGLLFGADLWREA